MQFDLFDNRNRLKAGDEIVLRTPFYRYGVKILDSGATGSFISLHDETSQVSVRVNGKLYNDIPFMMIEKKEEPILL